jgi:hypothetical protein
VVIKKTSTYVLAYIFKESLSTGIFPTRLTYSEIIPIYKKKGGRADMSNCGPTSLFPTFSKIFEKIIYKIMSLPLSTHNILAKEQFGFRRNSSTALATCNLLDNIYVALNSKCVVGGIFCNLSTAFD